VTCEISESWVTSLNEQTAQTVRHPYMWTCDI